MGGCLIRSKTLNRSLRSLLSRCTCPCLTYLIIYVYVFTEVVLLVKKQVCLHPVFISRKCCIKTPVKSEDFFGETPISRQTLTILETFMLFLCEKNYTQVPTWP